MANCPNCGDAVPGKLEAALMAVCPSCDTTLYIDDGRLLKAGEAGEMHDSPLLMALGDLVEIEGAWLQIVGHARFSYGPGWWDEFWAESADGSTEGRWISVDEGDVVVQLEIDEVPVGVASRPRLGDHVTFNGDDYVATEVDDGTCIALRGVFPERLAVGETYGYVNFSGPGKHLLSAETSNGETDWFLGAWLDPFELKVERA